MELFMSKEDIKEVLLKIGAHQLRSPISTIQTQLKTILAIYEQELPSKIKRLLEGACRKSEDMLALLNDLLEIAKMEDEHIKNEFKPVDLDHLFNNVIENLSEKAEIKEIDFQVEKKDKLPTVWGHKVGLKHICYNLIENAVKYTSRGGRVTVKVYFDDKKGILYGYIKDTGIGIAESEIKNIFHEFYRAPNAKSEEKMGTGLGLTIVSKAIDIHKGDVKFESSLGEGTVFKFSIPLVKITEDQSKELREIKKDKEVKKIVIIGGRTAGPKAAAKARRMDEKALITIIEKDKSLAYAGCGLPYYISGMVSEPKALMTTNDGDIRDPEFFKQIKDIEVLNKTKVISIDRENKEILTENLETEQKNKISYDKLILATGSKSIVPKIKGINKKGVYTLHRVEDAEGLRKELRVNRAKDVVIIGGGLLGASTAEALSKRGARVTIVETTDQILRFLDKEMATLVQNYFESHGIRVLVNQKVRSLSGDEYIKSVITNETSIPADLIIFSLGVKPEVNLAKSCGLEIGITGAIKINEYLQTSDPDIYAIGDCVENTSLITDNPLYTPFGSIAIKQGRIAGINVIERKEKFEGVLKTTIMKFFNYNIAAVGLNERQVRKVGLAPISVIVPGPDRDHFYPSAKLIYVKLIADRKSKRILGAQIIGQGEVSKRIDIIATAISAKMNISDISKLDLAYAPPYSSSMDIIIMAANVLNNKHDGSYTGISALELKDKLARKEDMILLDVRTHHEYDYISIPASIHIPLNSLRGRLHQLPKNREIIICCRSGVNAYEALRIFKANGYNNVKVLEGGILTYLGETIELFS
jgi:NADPH-dependent 2,4-dienoyl-CoA reductase/sulfur reductase-like enzyme/rhodanese-related sulfurtransferase/two-component sensor histidine kinase